MPTSGNQDIFDLVVIGGGINGAAIARDAALRNLKTILFEKNDFGSGASSKTSKLAHGGIRYLQQFQFNLVKESLEERSLLLKNAPHLVKPLHFLFPVYAEDPQSLWKINLGLYLYDFLAGNSGLPRHRKLNAESLLKAVPGLKNIGLDGGCSFYDAQMLDNRIVIENILSAEKAGAVVHNHTKITGLIRDQDQIKGVTYLNTLTGEIGDCYGRLIVNATGAWSGNISDMEPGAMHCKPKPTKGVHLIVPEILTDKALLLHAPQDGRVFFVLPWGPFSLLGTTDTFYDGNPDHLVVDNEDKNYLLTAINSFFPEKKLTEDSIIASFAGLRPLVSQEINSDPSDIFREHVIQISSGGLVTILGGKYTTHRLIAEEVVDIVIKRINISENPNATNFVPCMTKDEPLPGASGVFSLNEVEEKLGEAQLNQDLVQHLLNTYGTASMQIWEIMQKDPNESEVIFEKLPYVYAELTYGVEFEHVRSLNDWLMRISPFLSDIYLNEDCKERIEKRIKALSCYLTA